MKNDRKYSIDLNPISLREERRRTGRYIAAALATCISMLGLYQAMVQKAPIIAGLISPAVIMFLYVFWVLYTASKTQKPASSEEEGAEEEEDNLECCSTAGSLEHLECLTEVKVDPAAVESTSGMQKDINLTPKEDNILADKFTRNKLNRTYSIA